MTSEVETFGIAAAEAMARGVPVVAMPSGSGLDDLVRSGGVLLADREIATAADTVERLLASPSRQRETRRRGATIASALDYSLLIGRLDELLRRGVRDSDFASTPGAVPTIGSGLSVNQLATHRSRRSH